MRQQSKRFTKLNMCVCACVCVSVCSRVRSCLEYTLLLKLNMHTDGIGTKQIVCTVRIVKAQRQNANTHGLSACERVLHGLFYVPACMNVHTLAPRLKQTMLHIYILCIQLNCFSCALNAFLKYFFIKPIEYAVYTVVKR